MGFGERLATLRKARNLTQQQLADMIRVHVSHLRRYEAGGSQPTLEIIKKMALAFGVSADDLIFESGETKMDLELKKQFEAVSELSESERAAVKLVLDGLLLRHEVRRLAKEKRE